MADESGESPLDIKAVLGVLEDNSSGERELVEAYDTILRHTSQQLSLFERDIVENGQRLVATTKKHIEQNKELLVPKALNVMGYCLNIKEIVGFLSGEEAAGVLTLWCKIISESEDRNTCKFAFWCISSQKFTPDIIAAELQSLLKAFGRAAATWWGQSSAVEFEGMHAIQRLCEQCPRPMISHCGQWGPVFLRLLVSQSPKVRGQAYNRVHKWSPALANDAEFLLAGTTVLKKYIEPALKGFFTKALEAFALRVCTLLLQVFKRELHQNTVINSLMSVQELAFRCSAEEIRTQAFQSWGVLIDILAEKDILAEWKFMELVMRVFKTRNANTEAVALEKLTTWWHYVHRLGGHISRHFDQIVKPLLQFCLGNTRLGSADSGSASGTPIRGMHNWSASLAGARCIASLPGSPVSLPAFPKVQQGGLEVLVHLLQAHCQAAAPAPPHCKLEALKAEVTIPNGVFLKNLPVLMSAAVDLTKCFATSSEAELLYVWEQLTSLVRSALEGEKGDGAVVCFLAQFQTLMSSEGLPSRITLKLFQLVCSLPSSVLSLPSLHSGSGLKCRAHSLCELLLSSPVVEDFGNQESFMTMFNKLVHCGVKIASCTLPFLENVGKLLDKKAPSVTSPEVLWRLWSVVAHILQDYIASTNQVEQDGDLFPNFGCLYITLMLPISHLMGPRLPQTVYKTAMKTWTELYHTFARLAALVSSAEPNIVVEELSQKILAAVAEENTSKDPITLDQVADVCQVMVDTIDFSSLTSSNPFMQGIRTTPTSKLRLPPRPLGNLHSFVALLSHVLTCLGARVQEEGEGQTVAKQKSRDGSSGRLSSTSNNLVEVLSSVVTHLTVSSLIGHFMENMASALAALFSSSKAAPPKLERLWQEMSTMLQTRFKGPYDSEMLQHLSPLLQATFTHPRRSVKNHSVQLWNVTFGASTAPLVYPANLQSVLAKMKEKTKLSLPGWSSVEVAVIEETPVSQMSQMDSQAPEPVVPGMPSPVRVRGSLLHKDISPKPVTPMSPKPGPRQSENRPLSGARKKLCVDFMPKSDFVVIKNTPKKPRVLTEHQKEVLKEKRVLPAMYNNLEASQDASLMSQPSSDTQDSSFPAMSPADNVIVVNSSQSQDLLDPKFSTSGQLQDPKPTSDKLPAPRRSSRRVRFEETGTLQKQSQVSDMLGKTSVPVREEGVRLAGTSSSEGTGNEADQDSPSRLSSPPPNLMAACAEKLISSSSGDTSMSAISTSQSSGEEERKSSCGKGGASAHQTLSVSTAGGDVTRKSPSQSENQTDASQPKSSQKLTLNDLKGTGVHTYTTLVDWLKKSNADKKCENSLKQPAETTEDSSTETKQQQASPATDVVTFVEETQSPKETTGTTTTAKTSVQETPTKLPMSSVIIEDSMDNTTQSRSLGGMRILRNRRSVTQVEKSSDSNLLEELPPKLSPPAPTETPAQPSPFSFKPPVVCDEVASQGFPVEQEDASDSPVLGSPEQGGAKKIKTGGSNRCGRVSQDQRDQALLDKHNLFGFLGLLNEDNSPTSKESDPEDGKGDEAVDAEKDLFTCSSEADGERFQPQLFATLRQTPPRHHSGSDSVAATADSSQKQSASSSTRDSPPASQESQVSNSPSSFDPTKESTLTDGLERAKKRKQHTPKKITDPQLLRRTSRRKVEKTSKCACCIGKPTSHHQNSPKNSARQSWKRPRGKQSPQSQTDARSPARKRTRRPVSEGVSPARDRMEGTTASTDTKKPLTTPGETVADLSPQDIGEKTPEMKTSSTPLRHSTTKRKLEVARRRSLRPALNKLTQSEIDHMVPSQAVNGETGTNMCPKDSDGPEPDLHTEESEKASEETERHQRMTVDSAAGEASTRATSRMKLKKLSWRTLNKAVRSPPKLRLRKKKDTVPSADKDGNQKLNDAEKHTMVVSPVVAVQPICQQMVVSTKASQIVPTTEGEEVEAHEKRFNTSDKVFTSVHLSKTQGSRILRNKAKSESTQETTKISSEAGDSTARTSGCEIRISKCDVKMSENKVEMVDLTTGSSDFTCDTAVLSEEKVNKTEEGKGRQEGKRDARRKRLSPDTVARSRMTGGTSLAARRRFTLNRLRDRKPRPMMIRNCKKQAESQEAAAPDGRSKQASEEEVIEQYDSHFSAEAGDHSKAEGNAGDELPQGSTLTDGPELHSESQHVAHPFTAEQALESGTESKVVLGSDSGRDNHPKANSKEAEVVTLPDSKDQTSKSAMTCSDEAQAAMDVESADLFDESCSQKTDVATHFSSQKSQSLCKEAEISTGLQKQVDDAQPGSEEAKLECTRGELSCASEMEVVHTENNIHVNTEREICGHDETCADHGMEVGSSDKKGTVGAAQQETFAVETAAAAEKEASVGVEKEFHSVGNTLSFSFEKESSSSGHTTSSSVEKEGIRSEMELSVVGGQDVVENCPTFPEKSSSEHRTCAESGGEVFCGPQATLSKNMETSTDLEHDVIPLEKELSVEQETGADTGKEVLSSCPKEMSSTEKELDSEVGKETASCNKERLSRDDKCKEVGKTVADDAHCSESESKASSENAQEDTWEEDINSVDGGAVCQNKETGENTSVRNTVEDMLIENMVTEDLAELDFPHNQAGLELEQEEATPALTESDAANKDARELEQGGNAGEEGVPADALSSNDADQVTKSTDDVDDNSEGVAPQQVSETSEESPVPKKRRGLFTSPRRYKRQRISKQELFDMIDQSDATAEEIIAYVRSKKNRKTAKARLFPSGVSSSLQSIAEPYGRGMAMLQHSLSKARQDQKDRGSSGSRIGSPVRPDAALFSPLTVGSPASSAVMESPLVSPGGSILKWPGKSRSQEAEILGDSLETPSKRRRVSFADPIISGESPAHEATLSKMPDYFVDRPQKSVSSKRSKLERKSEKPVGLPVSTDREGEENPASITEDSHSKDTEIPSSSSISSTPVDSGNQSPGEPSRNSYHSTQESQLDSADPVFPQLTACNDSVTLLLPKLTSTIWCRGLEGLLKSLGVHTVGDLASLSEVKVQSLPISAPKVDRLKTILADFHSKNAANKSLTSGPQGVDIEPQPEASQ